MLLHLIKLPLDEWIGHLGLQVIFMLLKKMFVCFSQCNNTETTTDALLSIKSLFWNMYVYVWSSNCKCNFFETYSVIEWIDCKTAVMSTTVSENEYWIGSMNQAKSHSFARNFCFVLKKFVRSIYTSKRNLIATCDNRRLANMLHTYLQFVCCIFILYTFILCGWMFLFSHFLCFRLL